MLSVPKSPGSATTLALKTAIAALLSLYWTAAVAEDNSTPNERKSFFPLYRDWFEDQGIDLPMTYGVGGALVYMNREIEIDDVLVSIGDRPAESISDRVDFDVENETILGSAKFDMWVLPFVNVYAMLGRTESEATLRTTALVQPPGGGDPLQLQLDIDQGVDGPIYGAGLTLVAGQEAWFGLLDVSYVRSDIDEFDSELDVLMASARLGQTRGTDFGRAMLWAGLFYVDTHRTISFSEQRPLLGTIRVEVDQRTKNPLTYQIGGSLQLTRNWEVLAEVGTNFDDASLVVMSASYRF